MDLNVGRVTGRDTVLATVNIRGILKSQTSRKQHCESTKVINFPFALRYTTRAITTVVLNFPRIQQNKLSKNF